MNNAQKNAYDMSSNSSMITYALNDLDKNILFVQNINYHLNTLKNHINLSDQEIEKENAKEILSQSFFDKIDKILEKNKNNESILINIGDIFYHLIRIITNSTDEYNTTFKDILYKILYDINQNENINSIVILQKNYDILLHCYIEKKRDSSEDIQKEFDLLFKLMNKYASTSYSSLFLLYSINLLSTLLSIIEVKIENLINKEILIKFIEKINEILSKTENEKIALKCLSIWEMIINFNTGREILRKSTPVMLIISTLSKFPHNETALAIKSSTVLLNLIERKDVEGFIKVLQCKDYSSYQQLISQEANNEINTTENYFITMKRNITRILILLSKEKKFFLILRDLNSLDSFLSILKSDYEFIIANKDKDESKEDINNLIKNSIYPELNLLLALIQNFSLNSNKNKMLNDIFFCLIHSLYYFYDNETIINSILDFLSLQESKIDSDSYCTFCSSKEYEEIFSRLITKYYNNMKIYNFINKLPLCSFYPELKKNAMKKGIIMSTTKFNSDLKEISKLLESITIIYTDDKKNNFYTDISRVNIKLLMGIALNNNFGYKEEFNNNTLQLYYSFCNRLIELIKVNHNNERLLIDFKETEHFCQCLTFIFSGIENDFLASGNGNYINEVKNKILIGLIKKFSVEGFNNLNFECINYISIRLHRLIEHKKIESLEEFFQSEILINFLLYNILTISSIENIEEKKQSKNVLYAKVNLEMIYEVFEYIKADSNNNLLISKFLRANGLTNILKISYGNIYTFDITKIIISIIHIISNKHFKESAILYQNYIHLKSFVIEFKNHIIFSTKKINDKIYAELMLYIKNIIKSCEIYDLCEETNLISYFIKESNDIFNFCSDCNNKTLQILFDIFSLISQNKKLLKFLISSNEGNFSELILNVTYQLKDNFDSSSNNIFICVIVIFTSIYKSKDDAKFAYTNQNWVDSLINIKNIIENNINNIRDIMQVLEMFMCIIRYEHNEIVKEVIMNSMYFTELKLKLVESVNYKLIYNSIEKCIMMIENPDSNELKLSAIEENNNLIKELKQISKSDRKNAVVKRRERANDSTYSRSRSNNNMENNPNLQAQFERICIKFNSTIDMIIEKTSMNEKIINECEELIELLKLINLFAKEKSNIIKIYDNGIISKLILIMNNEDVSFSALHEGFTLLCKLISYDDYTNKVLEDAKTCEYFLNEFDKIDQNDSKPFSEYEKNKLFTITKIISVLSQDKSFVVNNNVRYLNEKKLIKDLSNLYYGSDICLNLLMILNNIIIAKELFKENNLSSEQKGEIIMKIWNTFEKDHEVIDEILTITESLYKDSYFVYDIINSNFILKIQQLLQCSTVDSNLIYHCITIIDLLMVHKFFISKIGDRTFFKVVIQNATKSIFNTKIVDKALSFIYKAILAEKFYINVLEENNINDLLKEILNKYMITCHSNLLCSSIEIIFILINNEDNFNYYTSKENFALLIKTFKSNLKSREQVLCNLKLFNFITDRHFYMIKKDVSNSELINSINQNYDYASICDIISDIFLNYNDYFDMIFQVCYFIKNIYYISNKEDIRTILIVFLLQSGTTSVKKNQMSHIELFIQNILAIIQNEKKKSNYIDGGSVLYFVNDVLKQMKINTQLLMQILKLLKVILREEIYQKASNFKEIFKILSSIEKNENFHTEAVIVYFSKILSLVCENTKMYNEIPNNFFIFILKFLSERAKNTDEKIQNAINEILSNTKTIAVYTVIEDQENANKVALFLYSLFKIYKDNTESKYLIYIFQIISSLSILSNQIKYELNSSANKIQLSDEINDMIKHSKFTEQLVEYQAKSCVLNLKVKSYENSNSNSNSKNNSSNLRYSVPLFSKAMDLSLSETKVDTDMKNFLLNEKTAKLYSDNGDSQKVTIKLILKQNSDVEFEKIVAILQSNKTIIDEMNISEMESCVRSVSTQAFKKAKGIFKKNKPKPARCFSILGIKNFNKAQKTFNVECDDENVCIKYVDYISSLINNMRMSLGKANI